VSSTNALSGTNGFSKMPTEKNKHVVTKPVYFALTSSYNVKCIEFINDWICKKETLFTPNFGTLIKCDLVCGNQV